MSKISKSEAEHFRAAMRDVQPLKPDGRHSVLTGKPLGAGAQRPGDAGSSLAYANDGSHKQATLVADACEQSRLLAREGISRKALRALGSAACPAEDSFDLHGMTESQARTALQRFIDGSRQDGLSCVRVVHGKGMRSQGPAVLKLMSWQYLWQHPSVLALKPCAPKDGGSGAVLVMLNPARGASK